MKGQFVFVRFFLGYTNAFPFKRFLGVKDDAIEAELEAMHKEWWSKPTNRKKFQTDQ